MSMMEDIRPVSYLKANTAHMLEQINETHRPVVITQNGEPRAVLQDPKSYERMMAAIYMMKIIAPGLEDIRQGRVVPHEEVVAKIRAKLKVEKKRAD